jgi:hypothetical protein
MYSAFIDANGVAPLVGTIPAIFAKSSMLWTSVIFISSNKKIRGNLLKLLRLSKKKAAALEHEGKFELLLILYL